MMAKTYKEWEPSNEQLLKLAEVADVFGQMVWDAALKAANESEAIALCKNLAKIDPEYYRDKDTYLANCIDKAISIEEKIGWKSQ